MKIFRPLLLIIFVIAGASWFSHTKVWKKTKALHLPQMNITYPVKNVTNEKIQRKAAKARNFTQQKKYNTSFCCLIDMSLPSGQKCFFIYDLKNDSVKIAALVAHGNCFEYWLEGRRYSRSG